MTLPASDVEVAATAWPLPSAVSQHIWVCASRHTPQRIESRKSSNGGFGGQPVYTELCESVA